MDLIFRYPNEKTAFIGLFMMERSHQGKGTGSKIIRRRRNIWFEMILGKKIAIEY